MTKKYQNPVIERQAAKADFQISLLDYVKDFAPEVLAPLPIMQEASALRFWQQTFQPAGSGEGKRLINETLRWPYAERLVYLAREFIKLDERYRRYIVKAAVAQIWWRGDDMQRFKRIVEAHLEYRGLSADEKTNYRKHLLGAMRNYSKP
jgi:hypothetical protein